MRGFTISAEQYSEIFDTQRRLMSLSYLGEVIEVKGKRARVRLLGTEDESGGGIETGFMPFLKKNAESFHQIEMNSKVLVFCPQAEIALGIILGVLDEEGEEADSIDPYLKFGDGTELNYNLKEKLLKLSFKDGGSLTVKDGTMTFSGDLTIDGKLSVKGDVSLSSKLSVSGSADVGDALSVTGDIKGQGEVSGVGLTGPVTLTKHTHIDSANGPTQPGKG